MDALGRLPALDCDPDRNRRILSEALGVLASSCSAVPSRRVSLECLYCRIIEPAWVAVLGAAFLVLAFSRAASVLH
jgi:hypothetical protein